MTRADYRRVPWGCRRFPSQGQSFDDDPLYPFLAGAAGREIGVGSRMALPMRWIALRGFDEGRQPFFDQFFPSRIFELVGGTDNLIIWYNSYENVRSMRLVGRFLPPDPPQFPDPLFRFELSTQFPAQLIGLSNQLFVSFDCQSNNISFFAEFDCEFEPDCDGVFGETFGFNPIYQSDPGTSFVVPPFPPPPFPDP